jgi:hypothetical protein
MHADYIPHANQTIYETATTTTTTTTTTTSSNCSAVWEIFVQLIGKSPDESFSGTYNMLILFLLIPILPTKQ